MTERVACPPALAPLEEFATEFDPLFGTLAQRRGFRAYLQGLLAPRERNKTLTALAGTEPIVGAQHPDAQRLQFFLSESTHVLIVRSRAGVATPFHSPECPFRVVE